MDALSVLQVLLLGVNVSSISICLSDQPSQPNGVFAVPMHPGVLSEVARLRRLKLTYKELPFPENKTLANTTTAAIFPITRFEGVSSARTNGRRVPVR